MLKKHWKKITGTLVGLVILVAGYALWHQHRMEQRNANPVKVFVLPEGYAKKEPISDTASEPKAETAKSDLKTEPNPDTGKKKTPPAPRRKEGDTAQNGHWHGDEWHAEAHEGSPVQHTAPPAPRGRPFANFKLDPNEDPVKAAYRRLDYISNNLHEWGDFSPSTLELMDIMTPVPARTEGEGMAEMAMLDELSALRDPRSAELLLSWDLDSDIMGAPVIDALEAMGPASVPPSWLGWMTSPVRRISFSRCD